MRYQIKVCAKEITRRLSFVDCGRPVCLPGVVDESNDAAAAAASVAAAGGDSAESMSPQQVPGGQSPQVSPPAAAPPLPLPVAAAAAPAPSPQQQQQQQQGSPDSDAGGVGDWCLPHFVDDCAGQRPNLLFGCLSAANGVLKNASDGWRHLTNTMLKNAFVVVQFNQFQQIIAVYTLQSPTDACKVAYTYGDSDGISFHIYASWYSPPSCG